MMFHMILNTCNRFFPRHATTAPFRFFGSFGVPSSFLGLPAWSHRLSPISHCAVSLTLSARASRARRSFSAGSASSLARSLSINPLSLLIVSWA